MYLKVCAKKKFFFYHLKLFSFTFGRRLLEEHRPLIAADPDSCKGCTDHSFDSALWLRWASNCLLNFSNSTFVLISNSSSICSTALIWNLKCIASICRSSYMHIWSEEIQTDTSANFLRGEATNGMCTKLLCIRRKGIW